VNPFQDHYISEILVAQGIEPGSSGSLARNSEHLTTEVFYVEDAWEFQTTCTSHGGVLSTGTISQWEFTKHSIEIEGGNVGRMLPEIVNIYNTLDVVD
jgi:hypothetical protein